MGRLLIAVVSVSVALLLAAGTASADPQNGRSALYSVQCLGLGSVSATAVFFPSDAPKAGATSAFHVVGSTTTLIVVTGGLLQLPTDVCLFTWIGGNPPPAVYEQFETNVFVAGS